jgi:hypothetical protein
MLELGVGKTTRNAWAATNLQPNIIPYDKEQTTERTLALFQN